MSEKEKIIIVWYKRDLRISDHAPLTEALRIGKTKNFPVIAMYSFEPSVILASDFSDFHRQFIEDALRCLVVSLENIGVPLLIFERNISDVMKIILEKYEIESVFSHEETGNNITYKRDILMARYLISKDIIWKEFPTN
jgi:deoxyribodipyrimidine photo-lyase